MTVRGSQFNVTSSAVLHLINDLLQLQASSSSLVCISLAPAFSAAIRLMSTWSVHVACGLSSLHQSTALTTDILLSVISVMVFQFLFLFQLVILHKICISA